MFRMWYVKLLLTDFAKRLLTDRRVERRLIEAFPNGESQNVQSTLNAREVAISNFIQQASRNLLTKNLECVNCELARIAVGSPETSCRLLAGLYKKDRRLVTDDLEIEVFRQWLRNPDRLLLGGTWVELLQALGNDSILLVDRVKFVALKTGIGKVSDSFLVRGWRHELDNIGPRNCNLFCESLSGLATLKAELTVELVKHINKSKSGEGRSKIWPDWKPAGGPSVQPLRQHRGLPPNMRPRPD